MPDSASPASLSSSLFDSKSCGKPVIFVPTGRNARNFVTKSVTFALQAPFCGFCGVSSVICRLEAVSSGLQASSVCQVPQIGFEDRIKSHCISSIPDLDKFRQKKPLTATKTHLYYCIFIYYFIFISVITCIIVFFRSKFRMQNRVPLCQNAFFFFFFANTFSGKATPFFARRVDAKKYNNTRNNAYFSKIIYKNINNIIQKIAI